MNKKLEQELFNSCFSFQCTPFNMFSMLSVFAYKTGKTTLNLFILKKKVFIQLWKIWFQIKLMDRMTFLLDRSSHRRCSVKKGVLRNFAKFTGKHQCQGIFLSRPWPATLIKNRLWHSCFRVNFAEFLRRSFWQNTSRRLLLYQNE